ncbi:hypothetical protein LCGC14_0876460 [marine sediment metagenome]|uniref:Uncharacterized protein n=1 Tax=marine sediment metagenome TaxID=412755 RepID=A0A0F9FP74_9ZZZZ
MSNPFRNPEENPMPDAAITGDAEVWAAIRHLRIRGALTDERVLFVMKWMFPVTWGVLLLILGTLLTS